ncbi:MAG: 3,4-dihydroxy-2-butanone-4-phosphate synthase [Alphaproteobacteria bacterium]|nr:3,4-dihydroxy-2-butanone-4-phosphate synthase [Alphaproteobacteria bacterium]
MMVAGDRSGISSAEEIIEEARKGHMFILSDDENRENEGDLIIPAEFASSEAVNFMARFGRGLICLALEKSRVDRLGLSLMSSSHGARHQTAFTVSIEAREGVTTGISAADRARTIKVAISSDCGPQDITSPGHIFPLVARDGGVLVRAGHTEAAVDISRMAGLIPAGVICEIMNEDGSMARMPDLLKFAQAHGIKVGTVADLIEYRRRRETIVERRRTLDIKSSYGGEFIAHVYVNKMDGAEHVALVKGNISGNGNSPVMVRMHSLNVFEDVLGDISNGHKRSEIGAAMSMISKAGRGVVVMLSDDPLPAAQGYAPGEDQIRSELKDYGVGAQILLDLGVRDMALISNSRRIIVGLEGYGLRVVEQLDIG